MDLFPYFYGAFGLIVGSFLNVCIWRLPRGESIVTPGSHCPGCGKPVRPYDNIPVLSYIFLLGRCRFCRQPISLQYPLVELLTGLTFFACARQWGVTSPAFVNSLFLSAILVLIFTDYHHQILPNVITLPGIAAGFLLSPFQSASLMRNFDDVFAGPIALSLPPAFAEAALPWISSALGALIGGGSLFLVGFSYKLIRKHQGLGEGDMKMMAMVGAFVGWRLAGLIIIAGSFLGAVVGLLLILFGGRNLQTKLAFGTFLGIATIILLFYGNDFLRWYASA
jgi:leader peptidase (prepilin peptidase) / N-methyltransferase